MKTSAADCGNGEIAQFITDWDVSSVTSFYRLFVNAKWFNQDISNWDTSNVIRMDFTFASAQKFNQDLYWDTSKVTNMQGMFEGAVEFNSKLVFDTSSVTTMKQMLYNAWNFNQDVSHFDTSKVTTMYGLFSSTNINQDLSSWNVSQVTNMRIMFWNSEFNQDISCWDVSSVTEFSYMFKDSDMSKTLCWDTTGKTTTDMFTGSTGSTDSSCTASGCNADGAACSADSDCRSGACDQDIPKSWAPAVNYWCNDGWISNEKYTRLRDATSVASLENTFSRQTGETKNPESWCLEAHDSSTNLCGTDTTLLTSKGKEWCESNNNCAGIMVSDYGLQFYNDSPCQSQHITLGSTTPSYYFASTCQPRCKENEHVSGGSCQACAAGKIRAAGDDPAGADTACETPRFKPADRDALKTAIDACVDSYPNAIKDGSECYACVDGTMKTSAETCAAGDTAVFITDWDTSLITDMTQMFYDKTKFDQPLNWDTSQVTIFDHMFKGTWEFNQDVSSFDVSKGTIFTKMFLHSKVNNPDISSWDMSSAVSIDFMVWNTLFDRDISSWDTSKVTDFTGLFGHTPFNRDISCLDISSATTVARMFEGADNMQQDLCWDTTADTTDMFLNSVGGSLDSSCTAACAANGEACTAASECISGVCSDSLCAATTCAENQHASGGSCVACAAGKTNAAGDPVTSDSACDSTLCAEDHHVVSNACQPCAQGKRPAGDDASGADTACIIGPCGGLTCSENSNCVNNVCVCDVGYGGMECTKDITAAGRLAMLTKSRKTIPTKEDIKQTQRDIKSFIKDTLQKELLTKSLKDAIRDTRITVAQRDLPTKARIVVEQLGKVPVIAVADANKDTSDTCAQGTNSARCSMLDIKENKQEVVFLSTDEEAGSWSVLSSGDQLISKQTRVSDTEFDMQCWNGTWGTATRSTETDNTLFLCNDHVILVGSQAAICTDETCQNGGTCSTDGLSFTCSCVNGFTGVYCETEAAPSHCHEIDCSDFGGHSAGACTDCTVANCCAFATRSLFDAHCASLSASVDFVEAKCCHRTFCV